VGATEHPVMVLQLVHWVSVVSVQAAPTYSPAEHVEQTMQAPFFKNVPGAQTEQTWSVEFVQATPEAQWATALQAAQLSVTSLTR
jgi:hypothetical protein